MSLSSSARSSVPAVAQAAKAEVARIVKHAHSIGAAAAELDMSQATLYGLLRDFPELRPKSSPRRRHNGAAASRANALRTALRGNIKPLAREARKVIQRELSRAPSLKKAADRLGVSPQTLHGLLRDFPDLRAIDRPVKPITALRRGLQSDDPATVERIKTAIATTESQAAAARALDVSPQALHGLQREFGL